MRSAFTFTLVLSILTLALSKPAQALPVSGAVVWFDASDVDGDGIAGNNPANGASISSWADKASTVQGAQNAVQATGSLQPTYAVGTQNGQASLNFANDVLVAPNLAYGTFTYFSVFRTSGPTAIVYERSATANSNDGEYFVTSTGSTLAVRRGGTRSHYNLTSGWAHTGNFLTTTHSFGGTHATHSMLVNGDTVTLTNAIVGDPGTGSITDSLFIGARSGPSVAFAGDISELIAYGSALNTAEANITNNYLSSKYDTPLSAPLDHYSGDTIANGDYDFDVFGIGFDDVTNQLTSSQSAGFGITATGTLDNTDFMLAGHKVVSNAELDSRWDRSWFLDNQLDGDELLDLTFDWSDASLGTANPDFLGLLHSSTDGGPFSTIAVGSLTGDTVTFTGLLASDLVNGYYTLGVPPVPEPSSFLLLGLGALGMVRHTRRRRRMA